MKRLLRSSTFLGVAVLVGLATMTPPASSAQARGVVQLLEQALSAAAFRFAGLLGVDLTDVDQQKAQALKLKEVRGAVITLIDHDAPAGQIGLRVNDVILQLNGQAVEGAAAVAAHVARKSPAGRKSLWKSAATAAFRR